jgi:Ca2+-transporting ATPase
VPNSNFNFPGLTTQQVNDSRKNFGENKLAYKKECGFLNALKRIASDPMIILLLTGASIYFISGKIGDGMFLTTAIIFQTSISMFQYSRSKNALEKLKKLSQPKCKVIRNSTVQEINSEELVVGDYMLVQEGDAISADACIVHSNDFSVNESVLTGESLAVLKDKASVENKIFAGTTVASGLAVASITAIGIHTSLGKIGTSLSEIEEEKTPLEKQISNFVKKMAIAGLIVFILVWIINYWQTQILLSSLLQSLTIAMSILPEEIPVAFTTFMALGAWRLMKQGVVVKQMKTVETLGSATVICTDKTGTLTENKMSLVKIYSMNQNKIFELKDLLNDEEKEIIKLAMWASEPKPFDPMEQALHKAYEKYSSIDERNNYTLVHEYPLEGTPPMMTHVFEHTNGERIIAAKGAPEAFFEICKLKEEDKKNVNDALQELAKDGYRILGVAEANLSTGVYPSKQQDFDFKFAGLVAFYDPPKANIQQVLEAFYNAGIAVKIITGDNAETTIAIAKQIGFIGFDKTISGEELMKLSETELNARVMDTAIFTRMYPEAKLKIINALKYNEQIVAMTGDGVNDGPALKSAHIGIAMGQKGTEIAKQAASLILIDDDLSKMVDAVAMGRKIYTNLKKAIQYIISIHIPIILMVLIPLAFGFVYPHIFSPIHIIFLEIIMGPTCSIIYENEPIEKNAMLQKPKALSNTFFNWKELSTSIVQGLVISLGVIFVYQYAVYNGANEALTRSMSFTCLITANIFLTLVNRSFYYSIFSTLKYKNRMVVFIISITILLLSIILFVPPITLFFDFDPISLNQLLLSVSIGFISVIWYELVKWYKRINVPKHI